MSEDFVPPIEYIDPQIGPKVEIPQRFILTNKLRIALDKLEPSTSEVAQKYENIFHLRQKLASDEYSLVEAVYYMVDILGMLYVVLPQSENSPLKYVISLAKDLTQAHYAHAFKEHYHKLTPEILEGTEAKNE